MLRRLSVIARLLAFATVTVMTASCEDEEKATPQIIFSGRIENGTGNDCQDEGPLFDIGDFGNQNTDPKIPSTAIKDGQSFAQGVVSVSCSVTPAGADEFDVAGSIDLSGATGGFFRIDGRFKTSGEQTGIHAKFASRRTTNQYEQIDRQCTVTYPQFGGVASGRIWGEITCPKAENPGAQKACEGVAEFRFENCTQ